jgi:hypothetical protein
MKAIPAGALLAAAGVASAACGGADANRAAAQPEPAAVLSPITATPPKGDPDLDGSHDHGAARKKKLEDYILDAAPADIPHQLDVNFENKIRLLGYKFEPESARPGQEVTLTYYWRCDDTVEDGWSLFTHTKDEGNGKFRNIDYIGPLRELVDGSHQALGPDRWQKGKVYVDEQVFKVPDDVAGEVTILVGFWKRDARLRIISGANDGDNSAIVGRIRRDPR